MISPVLRSQIFTPCISPGVAALIFSIAIFSAPGPPTASMSAFMSFCITEPVDVGSTMSTSPLQLPDDSLPYVLRERTLVVEVMSLHPGVAELHVQVGPLRLAYRWHLSPRPDDRDGVS